MTYELTKRQKKILEQVAKLASNDFWKVVFDQRGFKSSIGTVALVKWIDTGRTAMKPITIARTQDNSDGSENWERHQLKHDAIIAHFKSLVT